MKHTILNLHRSIIVFLAILCSSDSFAQNYIPYDSILNQMRYSVKKELLDVYYPRNMDSVYGGFLSDFSFDFKPKGKQDKMIVTQARHVWTNAKAAEFYKDTSYIAIAHHGYLFLRDKMWDKTFGGFYNLVNRQGEMISTVKEAYGNAFAIYALAAYFKASKNPEALSLAKKAFAWLDKNSHDPIHKGYYQHLERNGKPVVRNASTPLSSNTGYKDQNSSIHLLEAFTELYGVWRDPLVKSRLQEMLLLIRDAMVQPKGYLQLFFKPDWKPVSNRDAAREVVLSLRYIDHVSFGHDVETAYLMMEATEAIGNHDDKQTMTIGKKMVDHALNNGWDAAVGGFYDQGYYFKTSDTISIIKESKNWWAQAEGLNTLLIFSKLYPSDKMDYKKRFVQLWNYVQVNLVDHVNGDWYEEGLDKSPERTGSPKSHIWKATYHNFRSLANCIRMLESN